MSDLRDRLAEALYQWTLSEAAPGGSRPPYLDPVTERRLRENSAARAEVCAAVVQPALDAKDAEIAELSDRLRRTRIELDHWRTVITAELREERDQLKQRADQAEEIAGIARDTSNRSEAERARAVQRAETAEAELAQARADLGRYDNYAVQIGAKEPETGDAK